MIFEGRFQYYSGKSNLNPVIGKLEQLHIPDTLNSKIPENLVGSSFLNPPIIRNSNTDKLKIFLEHNTSVEFAQYLL